MHTRRMVVAVVALCTLFVSSAGASPGDRSPARPLAEMTIGASRVDWQTVGDDEQLALTVAGPGGLWLRKEFVAGQSPSLSLDQNGKQLPEGTYVYELRRLTPEGDSARPILQVGSFTVRNGGFATAFEERKTIEPPMRNAPAAPRVLYDKVVTPDNECLGSLCVAGDDAGPPILRLKDSYGVGILFDDVSDGLSYDRNWLLQANPYIGGPDHFFLQDVDAGTTPFSVFGNSPDYSLVVGSGGKIGIGTVIPGAPLHLYGSATSDAYAGMGPSPASGPAFNFGYGGGSFGRGSAFLNASPDASATAPNPSLRFLTANVQRMIVTNTGNVGIGTTNPGATLHVGSGEVRFPPGAGAAGFTHFNLVSDGKNYIRGTTLIADNGGSVGIGTTSPSSKLHVNGGDIRVSGGAFIDDGVTLNAPDYVFEPSYSLMPLGELREFVAREKHLPNVPAAADIKKDGLNLSQFQMRLLEKIEELALYTLQQEEGLQSLRDENRELKARLEALERAKKPIEP